MNYSRAAWLVSTTLLATPCILTAQQGAAADVQPAVYTVPAGTRVLLSLRSGVNTKTAQPGDGVYLVSTFPVTVGPRVLIPSGVYVQGVIDKVERPGHVHGRAKLLMHFTTMIFPGGQVVSIPGAVDNLPGSSGPKVKDGEGTIEQGGSKGKDAIDVARGGMIGATGGVIGGSAAGDPLKGAAIGGLAGVAGGVIYTLLSRGSEVVIPEGTSLEMIIQRPLALQASQADGIRDVHMGPAYAPAAGQPQPLEKPAHIICPTGGLGCN